MAVRLLVLLLVLLSSPLVYGDQTPADALLSIDQNRATVVNRVVKQWGEVLTTSQALDAAQLRDILNSLRADHLLAASLAGSTEGLRDVIAAALVRSDTSINKSLLQTKALGDVTADVTYVPLTPCRLVDTRGFFSPVYAGGAFTPNEIRTYTVQGGNGTCLSQLPAGLNPAALQMQVFAMPTTSGSGDLEILPQGAGFGSTATMVYVASLAFNTVSANVKVNTATNQISMQVRGGGANVAIDVVGYFASPSGTGGAYFRQGGNAFGVGARLGTLDVKSLSLVVNNQRALSLEPTAITPNIVGGYLGNFSGEGTVGVAIGGGGGPGTRLFDTYGCPSTYGCANVGLSSWATVGGGAGNEAGDGSTSGIFATVSGGFGNVASGQASTATGYLNIASGYASVVAGGGQNQASGNYATVAGGSGNIASGAHSFAAGAEAKTTAEGEFVWSDFSFHTFDPSNRAENGWFDASNTFNVRATGGVWFVNGLNQFGVPTIYCTLQPGDGSGWHCPSSRTVKSQFQPVDVRGVLQRVLTLPLDTWRFVTENDPVRHMGPMAEDFFAAFSLGSSDKSISTTDGTGVALAAIQGLNAKLEEQVAGQQREIAALRAALEQIRSMLEASSQQF